MELARLDLARRREGDVLGAAQAGRSQRLRLLSVVEHESVIDQAGQSVAELSEQDPTWDG
ncbi:hypothetical protein [Nesterenkonia pannonica]|nr:hypothetical protein [Nesterenkonia pannonica]